MSGNEKRKANILAFMGENSHANAFADGLVYAKLCCDLKRIRRISERNYRWIAGWLVDMKTRWVNWKLFDNDDLFEWEINSEGLLNPDAMEYELMQKCVSDEIRAAFREELYDWPPYRGGDLN